MNKLVSSQWSECLSSSGAWARVRQGIPVIDLANLIQTVQQVINDITQITNQVQQIMQMQDHLNSINGKRNLGNVFNNPHVAQLRAAEAFTYGQCGQTRRLRGLNGTAKGCATRAWSTTAWTSPATARTAARQRWPSRTSTRACCRTR
jgi:conjugal transfer/entry exclusion protein